ncbi:amino acid aminotransferase [Methylobacterium aerolatum]|uniref:Aminotransferase n=1 Tax=Methylobacterium aerolatum TaxID=418708 RepID=A0ABU0I153_9HYPH|nr:amino acid aminotransferase [Methylobacterium aerolatum]MDQ0447655.1 aromatic-amino-acid transaminase [Methylobacterium aerolatum]GJD34755.1 Aromatic-amino-acid aminotransferase [Methylobacterium aerolatum]
MTSLFAGIQDAPLDPIMRLFEAFNADTRPGKLNLAIGVYTDAEGKVPRLRAVQEAEKRWIEKGLPKTYRPIEGTKPFRDAVQALLFGDGAPILSQNRAATLQSVGGTGALKIGADVLAKLRPGATVAVSDPTWENHRALFTQAGFTVTEYPYFSADTGGVDYPAMRAALAALPAGSIVVLHACCHNPTGADLTAEEWADLVPFLREKGLIPFLDIAYQGFGIDLDADAAPVRLLAESGQEFFVASSFSKSFSLYGERVGALTVVASDPAMRAKVEALAKRLVRWSYSNPVTHGAAIVEIVLTDPALKADWVKELGEMRERIKEMRVRMADSLHQRHPDRGFEAIKAQKGMFSYTGLSPEEAVKLREEHEVYALETGRICVAAVNTHNIDRVLDAIDGAVKG